MTRVIDISLGIGPQLLTWPGDPGAEILPASRIAEGAEANVSELRLGSHTGTHVDPPFHFIPDGATVEELDLNVLVGDAVVADLTAVGGSIGAENLEALALPDETSRLLLKTRNSRLWADPPAAFPEEYVALTPEGARWVIEGGIRLVGTDFLSIEARGASGHSTHRALLEADVVILEGLDLSGVEAGPYALACLPLKVMGGDGAPARAVLIEG